MSSFSTSSQFQVAVRASLSPAGWPGACKVKTNRTTCPPHADRDPWLQTGCLICGFLSFALWQNPKEILIKMQLRTSLEFQRNIWIVMRLKEVSTFSLWVCSAPNFHLQIHGSAKQFFEFRHFRVMSELAPRQDMLWINDGDGQCYYSRWTQTK